MAFRGLSLLRNLRYTNAIFRNSTSTVTNNSETYNLKKIKTEANIAYLEDPDSFGTLSRSSNIVTDKLDDDGDIREENFLKNVPLKSQQLSIKQYADLIKQYLKFKRIKEAIDILEVRMLQEDRVKPENYIYNILIGACAEVGYTKKAFKLFNDMKRRALKPTGDTYTCLFEACMNSPFPAYGLKMATHLRNLMIEKGVEPNITNYNVMIKTFGRCSDLNTAFQIVDEMISKKIKIRVHTFNHLLHACISNKESGLKHALVVWRKMLKMRERPNIHSFNLILRCVKDCNLGTKKDMLDVISIIQEQNMLSNLDLQSLQIESSQLFLDSNKGDEIQNLKKEPLLIESNGESKENNLMDREESVNKINSSQENCRALDLVNKIELVDFKKPVPKVQKRSTPNLLSKIVQIDQVMAFQDIKTPQDKFAIIGGQEDFLREMQAWNVKPDVKTCTQMLPLIDNNIDAEIKLIETMKTLKIRGDIEFYNTLIKKRCLRNDYATALEVQSYIENENKLRKTHPLNKKNELKPNIMTYGVLAMACSTRAKADELLSEMKEKQLKVNIEILGTLLKNGTRQMQFGYILHIMDIVRQENLKVNEIFIKHLEAFNDKCFSILERNKTENRDSPIFTAAFNRFSNIYNKWLDEININEALKKEHPWKQFTENQPSPIQRDNITIVEPKKFYKRNRKFIPYATKI